MVQREKIGILNLGVGNFASIKNAIYSIGFDYHFVSKPADFEAITHLVMPGVGNYRYVIENLDTSLINSIQKFANENYPILGICLGMQLLSTLGTESGNSHGLNLIEGVVEKINQSMQLKVPHVGWNEIEIIRNHPILENIKTNVDFYFTHSYFFNLRNQDNLLAKSFYGIHFPSIIADKSIVGVQFHPEKSQINGLKILENFCFWDGKC